MEVVHGQEGNTAAYDYVDVAKGMYLHKALRQVALSLDEESGDLLRAVDEVSKGNGPYPSLRAFALLERQEPGASTLVADCADHLQEEQTRHNKALIRKQERRDALRAVLVGTAALLGWGRVRSATYDRHHWR